MMKKIMIYLIITVIFLNVGLSYALPVINDIENHWSQKFVEWAVNEVFLLESDEEGNFRPSDNITRGDFIIALNNLLYYRKLFEDIDILEFTYDIPYEDIGIEDSIFYSVIDLYNYINFNTNTGITFEDIFQGEALNAEKYITRKEAMLLVRAVTTPPVFALQIEFLDMDENMLHADKIIQLINNGIINGYSDSTLRLYRNLTRAESVVILKRAHDDMHYFVHDYLSFYHISTLFLSDKIVSSYVDDVLVTSLMRRQFINAAITLDYEKFVGHIPFQERHLYDMDAMGTLFRLKEEGYEDVFGMNYYLVAYSESLEDEEKITLIKNSLGHLSLAVPTSIQGLFRFLELAEKYISEDEIISYIESFYFASAESEIKFKAGIYMTEYYFDNDRIEKLLFIYEELLKFDTDVEKTLKLISNFGRLTNNYLGREEAINSLKLLWDSMKEKEMYEFYESEIDGVFIGTIKQIKLQTDENITLTVD
ncbi:S-layer homology domain-containing protein [Alkaliphilus sp. AH-315-G20]|nr:S-layer homology domain-containing protein [Alkaliphilus sp. AH-315-G20]